MRVLFCGGKIWGRDALQVLLAEITKNNMHDIVGVVVNNTEFGPWIYSAPIYDLAVNHKLPIFVPQTSDQIVSVVQQTRPDLIISVFYDRLFPSQALALAPEGGINLHIGDAELYRGCYAAIHALLGKDKEFGVTLHRMTSKTDAGDIIDKVVWPIDEMTTGYDLYVQAEAYGIKMFAKNIADILARKTQSRAQDSSRAKYYPRVLPQKAFDEDEVMAIPQQFLDAVRIFDFYGFEGVSLKIGREDYVVYNKRYLEGVQWVKKPPNTPSKV